MTDTVDMNEVAEWAADLYEQRTRQLAETGSLPINQVHPAYRVTTHEVMRQFSFNLAPCMVEFQAAFQRAIRRRHLTQVLKGKMYADAWLQKYGGKK